MIRSSKTNLDIIELSKINANPVFLGKQKIKLALLADCASQHLANILKNLFLINGIALVLYESDYNTIEANAYDAGSNLYSFNPDYIVIFNSVQALRERYYLSENNKERFVNQEAEKIQNIWSVLRGRLNASIIQTNFATPHERLYGNQDVIFPQSLRYSVLSLNQKIAADAALQKNVFIQDINYTASYAGTKNWLDEKMWVLYKIPCALNLLPYVAQSIVETTLSLQGAIIKCIVLDLDNTLWGGMIGEDGLEGIRLGHYEDGESYQLFQKYLLELKKRGVLLTVCSKNDADKALLPFRSHPEMILKETDITLFVANWENKAKNLKDIKEILKIGYDSMVFLDDSSFERALIRECLPNVIVPELPEDPAEFVKTLSELNLFEITSISFTDASRTQIYREEFERKRTEKEFSHHNDYLKSLSMKISISKFTPLELPRIIQLMQRSNQFNLMTRRFNEAECKHFMGHTADYLPLYIKLSDKYGDSGLISTVVLKLESPDILIEEWVMSCRVLARGVEYCVMNYILDYAKKNNFHRLIGKYRSTEKNAMVSDFYKQFGFIRNPATAEGVVSWSLEVDAYLPKEMFFKEVCE
ncbi:MAG: HAD family hydrolase [Nitrospirae bacterium]|nr:HAD family hydrolase [Nitrospirota bacterium]